MLNPWQGNELRGVGGVELNTTWGRSSAGEGHSPCFSQTWGSAGEAVYISKGFKKKKKEEEQGDTLKEEVMDS